MPSHGDKRVYAYICGPTVYDSAHMGHARCVRPPAAKVRVHY